MKRNKVIVYFITMILAGAGAYGGATGLQLLPLAIFGLMGALTIWGKLQLSVPITILSVIMVLVNIFATPSAVDAIVWLAVVITFYKEEENVEKVQA